MNWLKNKHDYYGYFLISMFYVYCVCGKIHPKLHSMGIQILRFGICCERWQTLWSQMRNGLSLKDFLHVLFCIDCIYQVKASDALYRMVGSTHLTWQG